MAFAVLRHQAQGLELTLRQSRYRRNAPARAATRARDAAHSVQGVLWPGINEDMVRYAVRHEFARMVKYVLARRSSLLFLDPRAMAKNIDAVGG